MTYTCPHCGNKISAKPGYMMHVRVCKLRPSKEELEPKCNPDTPQRVLAEEYGVSKSTMARWLREYGINTGNGLKNITWRKKEIGAKYAPMLGVERCPCEREDECRELMAVGGWPLCSKPTELELEWAKRTGLVERYE